MERFLNEFIDMFDESMGHINQFKKSKYPEVVAELWKRYEPLITESLDCYKAFIESEGSEEAEVYAETLARGLACHAHDKMKKASKRMQEIQAIDLNLTMAVYFIPLIRYTKSAESDALAEIFVRVWNDLPVTPMTLQSSSFEDVNGGFKTKLCYITTAVCKYQGKADNCYELTTLREYRDSYLMKSLEGRGLVEEYYEIAPRLVMTMGMLPDEESLYQDLYRDYLLPCLRLIEDGRNEACKGLYKAMVLKLMERFVSS